MYSSALTTDSPAYSRVPCGGPNYYEARQLNVVTSGSYVLYSISDMQTYGYIYQHSFDPFDSSKNILSEDNGGCPISQSTSQFKLEMYLNASTTDILVVTTFKPRETGEFSVVVSGPNNVSLNRFSKYSFYLVNNQYRIIE
jgi:hypothetical protein